MNPTLPLRSHAPRPLAPPRSRFTRARLAGTWCIGAWFTGAWALALLALLALHPLAAWAQGKDTQVASVEVEEDDERVVLVVGGKFNPAAFNTVTVSDMGPNGEYVLYLPGAKADEALGIDVPHNTYLGALITRVENQPANSKAKTLARAALTLLGKTNGPLQFLAQESDPSHLVLLLATKPPPPPPPPAPEVPQTPEPELSEMPLRLRVVVLAGQGGLEEAKKSAAWLRAFKRVELETKLGMMIDVLNVSRMDDVVVPETQVAYRPGFLRAALLIAEALPGEQKVVPMPPADLSKNIADVEILHAGRPNPKARKAPTPNYDPNSIPDMP